MGCTGSSSRANRVPEITTERANYPESALASLPSETVAEIEEFSASVALPDSIPLRDDEDVRQVYMAWYRKGYAFAFVTGAGHLRDQISRQERPQAEQAKVLGWFDGNSAGRLARRLSDIEAALGAKKATHSR